MTDPDPNPKEKEKIEKCTLGTGKFGVVYQATFQGHEVAVKIFHQANVDPKSLEHLTRLSHVNLGKIYNITYYEPDGFYLIQELGTIDLEHVIQDETKYEVLSWKFLVTVILQIGYALHYLFTRPTPILHRDLKASNVLLRKDGSVFLVDYGFENKNLVKGTGPWIDPALGVSHEGDEAKYNPASDIFSLGLIMYELLMRKKPLSPYIPLDREEAPEDYIDLTNQCCRSNPAERPIISILIERLEQMLKLIQERPTSYTKNFKELLYSVFPSLSGDKPKNLVWTYSEKLLPDIEKDIETRFPVMKPDEQERKEVGFCIDRCKILPKDLIFLIVDYAFPPQNYKTVLLSYTYNIPEMKDRNMWEEVQDKNLLSKAKNLASSLLPKQENQRFQEEYLVALIIYTSPLGGRISNFLQGDGHLHSRSPFAKLSSNLMQAFLLLPTFEGVVYRVEPLNPSSFKEGSTTHLRGWRRGSESRRVAEGFIPPRRTTILFKMYLKSARRLKNFSLQPELETVIFGPFTSLRNIKISQLSEFVWMVEQEEGFTCFKKELGDSEKEGRIILLWKEKEKEESKFSASSSFSSSSSSSAPSSFSSSSSSSFSSSSFSSSSSGTVVSAPAQWPCNVCTFLNPAMVATCQVCNLGQNPKRPLTGSSVSLPLTFASPRQPPMRQRTFAQHKTELIKWTCPRCTLINAPTAYFCRTCKMEAPKPSTVPEEKRAQPIKIDVYLTVRGGLSDNFRFTVEPSSLIAAFIDNIRWRWRLIGKFHVFDLESKLFIWCQDPNPALKNLKIQDLALSIPKDGIYEVYIEAFSYKCMRCTKAIIVKLCRYCDTVNMPTQETAPHGLLETEKKDDIPPSIAITRTESSPLEEAPKSPAPTRSVSDSSSSLESRHPKFKNIDQASVLVTFDRNLSKLVLQLTTKQKKAGRSKLKKEISQVRAIFVWIVIYIKLDNEKGSREPTKVLDNRAGTAEGIAHLFAAMAEEAGFKQVLSIAGITKSCKPGEKQKPAWWNAIAIDNELRIVDCVASLCKDLSTLDDTYFAVRPEYAIYQRFPNKSEEQFCEKKMNRDEFLSSLPYTPSYFLVGLKELKSNNNIKPINFVNVNFGYSLDLPCAQKENVKFYAWVYYHDSFPDSSADKGSRDPEKAAPSTSTSYGWSVKGTLWPDMKEKISEQQELRDYPWAVLKIYASKLEQDVAVEQRGDIEHPVLEIFFHLRRQR